LPTTMKKVHALLHDLQNVQISNGKRSHKLKNIPPFTFFFVYAVAVQDTPLLITQISYTSL